MIHAIVAEIVGIHVVYNGIYPPLPPYNVDFITNKLCRVA